MIFSNKKYSIRRINPSGAFTTDEIKEKDKDKIEIENKEKKVIISTDKYLLYIIIFLIFWKVID